MPKPSRYITYVLFLILAPSLPAYAGLKEWLSEKVTRSEKLDPNTVAAGLRQALEQGTRQAVGELGRDNGFWKHPTLRIPVPEKFANVERGLRRIGQGKVADDFVRSLNRAAEQATPAARDIFVNAIRQMTVRDATDILKGADAAATLYFRRHTEAPLASAFKPIVTRSTEAVGVTAYYKRFVKKAQPLGLIDTRNLDIDDYVTRKALDGLFSLVAEEEKRIRKDPVAHDRTAAQGIR